MRRFFYYNSASVSALPLLLDFYPAAAAYSVRKLRAAYTGACMRVRRSSDNAEQDIGFVSGELDTTALLSFVGVNDGFVVTWYDQTGNGFTRGQFNASQQMRIVTSGVLNVKNSKPSIFGDGSTRFLRTVVGDPLVPLFIPAMDDGNQFSVFSVHHSNLLGAIRGLWQTTATGSNNQVRGIADTRTTASPINWLVVNSGGTLFLSTLSAVRNDTNQRLQVASMDASNLLRGFDNGATGGTATYTGSYANSEFIIGSGANGSLNGGVQELIIFDTNQLANRVDIQNDINTYYGIY